MGMISYVQKEREQGKAQPLCKDRRLPSEVQRSLQCIHQRVWRGGDVLNVVHDQFWMILEQNI